jgi:hypothetical protein
MAAPPPRLMAVQKRISRHLSSDLHNLRAIAVRAAREIPEKIMFPVGQEASPSSKSSNSPLLTPSMSASISARV